MATVDVDIDAQYRLLREEAGWVERDAGVLIAHGAEAAEYLHSQVTNDVESLAPGEGTYAALLDRKGGMQADMRILRRAEDALFVITESAHLPRLLKHLAMYKVGRQVEVEDGSGEHRLLSVIGPATQTALGVAPAREHHHASIGLGQDDAVAIATDTGVDLLTRAGTGAAAALQAAGIESIGEEAAEIVRIESGRPRLGVDIATGTLTQEAGLNERAVSFTKGCYIGQETVARLHYKGKPNRELRGLRASRRLIPGEELRAGERVVGTVGSSALSPALGPIALALVRREAAAGTEIEAGDDGAIAAVVELPFRNGE